MSLDKACLVNIVYAAKGKQRHFYVSLTTVTTVYGLRCDLWVLDLYNPAFEKQVWQADNNASIVFLIYYR